MSLKRPAITLALLAALAGGCDREPEAPASGGSPAAPARSGDASAPAPGSTGEPESDRAMGIESRLTHGDESARLAACRSVDERTPDDARLAQALVYCALCDDIEEVRREAVNALRRYQAPSAIDGLGRVVARGEVTEVAWKNAAYGLAERAHPVDLLHVFARKVLSEPEASAVLADALRQTEPTPMVKAFLLDRTEHGDASAARAAGECLFSYGRAGADAFDDAMRNVMPKLDGYLDKLDFARAAVKTQTMEAAGALAGCAADSDDPDDWRAAVEVFHASVLDEHQEFFDQIRDIAVKVSDWRFQKHVRALLREKYADDMKLTIKGESFTFDAIWTRADLLDWREIQRRTRRQHAIMWVSALPRQFEIAVITAPKDYLLLDENRAVIEMHRALASRGVQTPPDTMYTIVLDAAIFRALDPGALPASAFRTIAAPGAAVGREEHVLYDRASGALFYDADGGDANGRIAFADIDNHAALTHRDLFVA